MVVSRNSSKGKAKMTQPSAPDLSVGLTAHRETFVAGPTMRSAEAAVAHARAAGFTVECLIGLDTAHPDTVAFFSQPAFAEWRRSEVSFRDQGLTRNALAQVATGRFLAFLDADDLFSENWLTNACRILQAAEAAGRDVIVHPEMHWQFDAIQNVNVCPAQDDPFFSPYVMSTANYYDALCVAPRRAWIDHPWPSRDIDNGFAFEDYQWFVEMTAMGWRHDVARDTIMFKRRRDDSQHVTARGRSALVRPVEPLAIDQVGKMLGKTIDQPEDDI